MLGSAKLYYSTDEENWTLIDTVKNFPFTFAFNTKELTDTEFLLRQLYMTYRVTKVNLRLLSTRLIIKDLIR